MSNIDWMARFMYKILFVANVGGSPISSFFRSSYLAAKALNIEFHVAYNWENRGIEEIEAANSIGIYFHQIDFNRNPFKYSNIKAYFELKKLLKENHYNIIHLNTPLASFFGRLCAKKADKSTVFYMAHGFNFGKTSSIFNKTLFKWIEMYLARCTDRIATMNEEDYQFARTLKLRHGGKVYKIHGVGIDISMFQKNEDYENIRVKYGIPDNAVVIISSGRLEEHKNQITIIKALGLLKNTFGKHLYYLNCGEGKQRDKQEEIANELGLSKYVLFPGYCKDIVNYYKASDIFIMASLGEGLPRTTMEAMALDIPCIVSDVRGNRELIKDRKYLFDPQSPMQLAERINFLLENKDKWNEIIKENKRIINNYDISKCVQEMMSIYSEIITDDHLT